MPQPIARIALTPEEAFLWDCARRWRNPAPLPDPAALDWARIAAVAESNRAQTLIQQVLVTAGQWDAVPEGSRKLLEEGVAGWAERAARMSEPLRSYLLAADRAGVPTVVMKGLSVSIGVYGQPAMRPGMDADLLVRRDQVQDCVAVLEGMGMGRWWPKLMDDRYYAQHHLHLLRCSPDFKTWFEIHWTLDHPYTLLTMDTDGLLERTTSGRLLDAPVRQMGAPDQVLSLAVHLVKHAVYLPSVMERPDLARIILADGMLVYYLDVAEVIKLHAQELDWALVVRLAREWGAGGILGSVLRVCREFLDAPVPEGVVEALPVRSRGINRWAMNRMADHEVAAYNNAGTSKLWDFLLMTNSTFILRPIRLLDTLSYFVPDSDYLRRRYGAAGAGPALRHLARATADYARLAVNTTYYTLRRNRHMRELKRRGELPEDLTVT